MEFPYKRNDFSDDDIKKMFKKLENAKALSRIKFDKVFTFPTIDFDINTFLFRYTYFDHPSNENYKDFDQLSDMFQEYNRIRCKRFNQELTPYEYFIKNQENLKAELLKQRKEITNNNLRELLFQTYKECTSFRPMNLKIIIKMFKATSILDFSSGWGDRLLAAMATNTDYVGIDANKNLFPNYEKMIKFFDKSPEKYLMIHSKAEDVIIPDRKYDLIFTSPPYFQIEKYTSNNTQSISQYKSMNTWLENFLFVAIKKCYDALSNDGHLVININQRDKHKENYVVRMIDYINKLPDSHFLGVIGYSVEKKGREQPIWIWKKSKESPKELYENDLVVKETSRLKIRVFRLSDLERLQELYSKEQNMAHLYSGKVLTKEETKKYLVENYIKQQYTMYAIENDGKIIGVVGYYHGKYLDKRLTNKMLLRIMIDVEYRKQGFAQESLQGLTDYLIKTLKYQRIYSLIEKDNIPSIKLHEKLNFKSEKDYNIHGKDYTLFFI